MQNEIKLIKENRITLLKYSFVMAIVCSSVSLFFQNFNNNFLPLAITLVMNLIFLFGMEYMYFKALNRYPYSWKDFKVIKKYRKQCLIVCSIMAILVVSFLVGIYFLSYVPYLVAILPGLIFILIVIFNCMQHLILFDMYKGEKKLNDSLRKSAKVLFSNRKKLFHIFLKTITILLIGSFIVYAINVFAYAPQIEAVLNENDVITSELIDPFFSTNLSYLIQSVGMQMVVAYISIVTGFTCGTLKLKKKTR